MKLYVLRHGETLMNKEDLIMGRTDVPLDEKGVEDAKNASKELLSFQNINELGSVFVSPLIRARQTANIVLENIGFNRTPIVDERLIEQNYGELEGGSRFDKEFDFARCQFASKCGKVGESPFRLAQRVYNLIDEVKEKCKNQDVLFVTHGGICRVIRTYFFDMTNDEYSDWRALNCQIDTYQL